MARLGDFEYLKPAFSVTDTACLARTMDRIVSSPSDEELGLIRSVVDEIEQRDHYDALRRWLPSAMPQDRGSVTRLLMVVDGLASNGKVSLSRRMRALIDEVFFVPEFCEENVPPRFRYLTPWLRRVREFSGDPELIDAAESLEGEELEELARTSERMLRSGDIDAINAWLDKADMRELPEAGDMMFFLMFLDHADLYPER